MPPFAVSSDFGKVAGDVIVSFGLTYLQHQVGGVYHTRGISVEIRLLDQRRSICPFSERAVLQARLQPRGTSRALKQTLLDTNLSAPSAGWDPCVPHL